MDNRMFWITGLSGAGKTTIGTALYYRLKSTADNVVLLDGDMLKEALGSGSGYTNKDRHHRAFQYARLCKLLADQGITVICCTIAMFEDVREWNRANIDGYIEVFLDVPHDILVSRDSKRLYRDYQSGATRNIAGFDIEAELPKNPDILLRNDGSLSVTQCVNGILSYSMSKETPVNRDFHYWNDYYRQRLAIDEPSPFAQYVLSKLSPGESLIDLGCGNGRDAVYFHRNGIAVTAVDQSPDAISLIMAKEPFGLCCVCGDITKADSLCDEAQDNAYSRFSIHALSEDEQGALIGAVRSILKPNGTFWIEARGIHDNLYGKGIPSGKDAFVFGGHYRRFIVLNELVEALEKSGFEIISAQESSGFAPFGDDDPIVIRVAARLSVSNED